MLDFIIEARKHKNGTYVSFLLSKESCKQLDEFLEDQGIYERTDPATYHCTIAYSKTPCPLATTLDYPSSSSATAEKYELFPQKAGGNCLVLRIGSETAHRYHRKLKDLGASYDYSEYKPHITLAANYKGSIPAVLPDFKLEFKGFEVTPLDEDLTVTNK